MTIEEHLKQEAAPGSELASAQAYATRAASWTPLLVSILIVVIANLAIFARCLNGYFLADDFVHIDYLHRLIPGNWTALAANFYGNWMQAEGTTFYRPLITVTMASDYLLYGAKAWGYHATNLAFQIASSIFLLLFINKISERMLPFLQRGQALLFATLAALLFALSPLHGEVVNWIIARVDSVALTFSLLSLWTFLLPEGSKLKKLSIASFIAALMSKEMAITVPPAALAIVFITSPKSGLKAKLADACKQTKFFWLTLGLYLGLRAVVLGTVSGGYAGSIGEGLSSSLIKRWTDGSLLKLFLPFNLEIFGAKHSLYKELKVLYMAGTAGFCLYLSSIKKEERIAWLKFLSFALVWLVISLLPTYQVWNLNDNLQGARFAYFATAPVALITGLILFAPLFARAALARFVCATMAFLLIGAFASVATANNSNWIHAQRELKRFREAVEKEALKGKIAVLNIPQSYKGAHMLYNAATMSVLMRPPLSADLSGKVITFEPATFGDSELVSLQRVRTLSRQIPFFYWERSSQKLVPLDFKARPDTKEKPVSETKLPVFAGEVKLSADSSLVSPPLCLNPLDYDQISLQFKESAPKENPNSVCLTAIGQNGTATFDASIPAGQNHLDIQLSERKGWLSHGQIVALALRGSGQTLTGMTLSRLEELPELKASGTLNEDTDGICRLSGNTPTFAYDVSMVRGAKGAIYELSRPNSWFEHYSGTLREKALSKEAALTGGFSRVKGANIPLSAVGVKGHGFFQLKVAGADENGNPLGYFSEPLNFQL